MIRLILTPILLAIVAWAAAVRADPKHFDLQADAILIDSGFLAYVAPRFSLKTGILITIAPIGSGADGGLTLTAVGAEGLALITDGTATYRARDTNDPEAARFVEWLASDVGKRAVTKFKTDGQPTFAAAEARQIAVAAVEPDGDAVLGEDVSLKRCGRCHVISDKNRFGGIGSTPSFGALRGMKSWLERFEVFWTLNPHPSFTQVDGVTEPFDPMRPPPIAPIILTLDEVDAILAYVRAMKPKDLGGPLIAQ